MMDEAAAREIERLQGIVDELEATLEAAGRKLDSANRSLIYWEARCAESERQRKQLSEYIETLAKGGIEAATGAGK